MRCARLCVRSVLHIKSDVVPPCNRKKPVLRVDHFMYCIRKMPAYQSDGIHWGSTSEEANARTNAKTGAQLLRYRTVVCECLPLSSSCPLKYQKCPFRLERLCKSAFARDPYAKLNTSVKVHAIKMPAYLFCLLGSRDSFESFVNNHPAPP